MGRQGSYILYKMVCLVLAATQWYSFSVASSNGIIQERDNRIMLSQPLTVRWIYPSDITTNLTPATDGEHVYLPLASGLLVSLNARDGKLNWRTDIGGELSSSPVADQDGIYVASETGTGPQPA